MQDNTKVINRGKPEKFILRKHMEVELGSSMANCAVSITGPKGKGKKQKLRVNKDFRAFVT